MTKTLTAIAVASLLGVSAFAQTNRTNRPLFAERLAELGITDAQKAQVRAILQRYQPTAGPMLRQLTEERRKLRDVIRAETIDETAIRSHAAKVAGLEADLAVERAHIVHEIKPLLTPEQIAKLKDMQVDIDERIDEFLSRVAKRITTD